jgi:2-alkenal reductase
MAGPIRGRWPAVALAAVVVAAGLAGSVIALVLRGSTTQVVAAETRAAVTTKPASPPAVEGSLTRVVAAAAPGVVSILATTSVELPPAPYRPPASEEAVVSGSGFVLDTQGHILTSDHLIEEASKIHVSFADGHKVHAKLLGRDPLLDLAVLSVNVPASTLHPLPLGSADALQLGDTVIAIGNPFGLDRSVSVGVVSGLGRQMVAPNGFTVSNAVQTDAAVNHGNSGGPLLDSRGRVVGVNAQIADSGVDANVGVAFAVAIDPGARRAIAVLKDSGTVQHAWLGVALDDIDAILATSGRVPATEGALVTGVVSEGPAASAGLAGGSEIATVDGADYCVGGDMITAVAGRPVTDAADLQAKIEARRPGEKVTLTVVRSNGDEANVTVTLGAQPTSAPETTTGCQ